MFVFRFLLAVFRFLLAVLLAEAADVGGVLHTVHFLARFQHQQGGGLADAVLLGQGGLLIYHHGIIGDPGVGQEFLGHHALGAGGGGEEEEAGSLLSGRADVGIGPYRGGDLRAVGDAGPYGWGTA